METVTDTKREISTVKPANANYSRQIVLHLGGYAFSGIWRAPAAIVRFYCSLWRLYKLR